MMIETAAVLIGVDKALGQPPLRNAERDVFDVGTFFRGDWGPVASKNVFVRTGERATGAQVIAAFEAVAARQPDVLFVMFSGHGDSDGLLLADDHFEYSKLAACIRRVGAKSGAVIIDGCSAGAAAARLGTAEVSGLPSADWQRHFSKMAPGMRLLLASRYKPSAAP